MERYWWVALALVCHKMETGMGMVDLDYNHLHDNEEVEVYKALELLALCRR